MILRIIGIYGKYTTYLIPGVFPFANHRTFAARQPQ
jgi:hypothetical protein